MSAEPSATPAIDSARYRQVLGHFPTGVTIITAAGESRPAGMCVGSFSSVSLDPPLVAFFAGKGSTSYPVIEAAGHYCVNILRDDQEEQARVFAGTSDDKFDGVGWRPSPATGAPLLDDVLAWIDCRIDAVHEAGDHWIVVGRVLDLEIGRKGSPLVFFRGGFGRYSA